MRSLTQLFLRIKEPRVQRLAFFALYGLLAFSGVNAFAGPPSSIEAVLGWVTPFWAGFSMLGGVLGAVSVLPGWWWVERIGAASGIFGSAIYGNVVLYLHFHDSGNRLTQWAYVCVPVIMLAYRLWETRRYSYEPRG